MFAIKHPWILAAPLLAFGLTGVAGATPTPMGHASRTSDGISLRLSRGVMDLEVWADNIVRVHYGISPAKRQSLAVIGKPAAVKWSYAETAQAEVLATAKVRVVVDRKTGAVRFSNASGKAYLSESAEGGKRLTPHGASTESEQSFALSPDEAVYGLGQHPNGLLNYRGSRVHLQQQNTDVGVPVLVSSKGYGLLWDNASVSDIDIPSAVTGRPMTLTSEAGGDIDYYFIAGPKLDDVVAGYRRLTGSAPMLARWAWGFWQCKERYQTQDELLGIATQYRQMGVPFDAVIQDWQYWPKDQWGSHRFDPERYKDPKAMVDQLHAMNVHTIVSVWPRFDLGTQNLAELEQAGGVYSKVYPNVYPPGFGKWYDPFNPKARQIYWSQIAKNLGALGFDGYWLDASEAELGGGWGEMREVTTAVGPGAEVYNAYPLMHTTSVYEGQRKDFPQKRALILTRSAFAGQQRNAAITWSGDTHGTWDTLRRQIPAGLNFSLSGIPYWNTDIGGFFADAKDPAYKELFIRWFQFGTFSPMFRVHGTGQGKEIWRFDADAQKILIAYDQLRYRLLPYIYSVAWRVTERGDTMMRPLVMDFADDEAALNIPDQYMFGPSLMVAPVTQQGAEHRSVYLPGRDDWYDFHTGKRLRGGQIIDAVAPLQTLPLYVRAGSILPMGPVVTYADAQQGKPLEIRIYRGADGHFELYSDAGDGYGYERGEHAIIRFDWSEKTQTLSLAKLAGAYPGMPRTWQFNIVWIDEKHGFGLSESTQIDRAVAYAGQALKVKAP